MLAIAESEQLLGWLYVGASVPAAAGPDLEPAIEGKLTALSPEA